MYEFFYLQPLERNNINVSIYKLIKHYLGSFSIFIINF